MTLFKRLKPLWPYFAPSRWGFVVAIVGTLVGAATEPAIPALMKKLLDDGFKPGAFPLWSVPVVIIGLFAVRGLAGFIAQYGLHWASTQGVEAMRRALFERLLLVHPRLFTERSASSLTNTLVYEVQGGSTLLVYSSLSLLRDLLTLLALLVYLLWLDWQLTLFVSILFPAVAIVMRTLSRRLHRLTVAGQGATDELAYVVEENVQAWRIVRLHGAEAVQRGRFFRAGEVLRRLTMKSAVANSAMTPLTQMLAAVALSAVVAAALWQNANSGSVGGFVAFVTALLMLIAPIKHVSEVAGTITRGLAALERAVALVSDTTEESSGTYRPATARTPGHIALRGVALRYRDDQANALDGVTLELKPGETVALVGPSGSGKSTLVNLLPRFIEPTSGEILLDGHALPEWDVKALRQQFALVSQDVVLFNDSVAANVALGGSEDGAIDRDRVTAALHGANLHDFIATLPRGIDTMIGHNGNELSGGQRQRLAIARAIYKDAPVLILDEATSALDSESEHLVQAALETLMRGRTTLVIAHRLSTIERADRIVALEGGHIAEQGTHAQLLAQGGLYARLHTLQFRGAQQEVAA